MTERHGETISAFLDGQLSPDEAERMLDMVLADDDQIGCLGRYRLIGDAMRGECDVLATDTVAQVRSRLVEEPTVLAPGRRNHALGRAAAGIALAASVAAVAIVVAPGFINDGPGSSTPIVAERSPNSLLSAPTQVASRATLPSLPTQVASRSTLSSVPQMPAQDALQRRLNRLVIEHQEFGGRSGLYGPVPHIGLVSYDR